MKRILLVDDEDIVTSTLAPILRDRLHLEVQTAGSGGEALEQLRLRGFDMVVTDYHMRDLNGFELLQRLRADHPATLRILITGEAGLGFREQVVGTGAVHGFIQKPYSLMRMQRMLRRLLDHPPDRPLGAPFRPRL